MKVLSTILSIAGFYLGYWICKSIFYSFLDGSTTVETVINGEWYIAGGLAGIIFLINYTLRGGDPDNGPLLALIPIALSFIATFMPFSIGFVVLYNVIIIGFILYSVWGDN